MCGIIGYIGEEDGAPIVLEGLARLEYRGYDSAGIALHQPAGLHVTKRSGRLEELRSAFAGKPSPIAMGHTRWATHGPPTDANAHPHTDGTTNLAIIHNGIIENHQELKEFLIKQGRTFTSDTDTEVLAHLISSRYDGDLRQAVRDSLALVDGAFGIVVMHADHEELVGARRGSPLVLGIGDDEHLLASDVPAVLSRTRKVVYLEDDTLVSCTRKEYSITRLDGSAVPHEVQEVRWSVDELAKGNFKHFMLKEIFEQPRSLSDTLRGRLLEDGVKLSVDVSSIKHVTIVACGTSWHSGLIGKTYIERLTGLPVSVDYASEFRYRDPLVGPDHLVIAISQSGETADTLAALQHARRKGAKLLGIVNVVGSSIARLVDSGIFLHAGPEIGVASTKAFTSQVAALLLLALRIAQEQGREVDPLLLAELKLLPSAIQEVLDQDHAIENIAKTYASSKNMLYLGRGLQFPVALEGALKLKEISYIHAEGLPAAEMKHGPIALIDEDMPVVFLAPRDDVYEKVLSNMQEVKARGGRIIAIATQTDPQLLSLADHVITVPVVSEPLLPIVTSIPLQLLAYHIADLKGLDVDKPRNLAKSVTVE